MTNEVLMMVLAFIAGVSLGILFFLGLWFTVKKVVIVAIPALWVFVSFFLRVGIVLMGFYFVAMGSWQRFLVCMLGFIIGRFWVVRFTKSLEEKKNKKVLYET
jgi:F1F0 ATPase subunit 2